jgi:hypothetical protein
VNSRDSTSPQYFFGRPPEGIASKEINQIRAAGLFGLSATVTAPTDIWMMSDIDGKNYNSSITGGGASVKPNRAPTAQRRAELQFF